MAKALTIKDISTNELLTDRQKIVSIGAVIDEIKTSNMFGTIVVDIVKDMINDKIDNASGLSANVANIIKTAVNSITTSFTFENEFAYCYDLVNSADLTSLSNFKTYLSTNLIKTDGTSKSGIITRAVVYDLVIDIAGGFAVDGLDISQDVVACLTADKNGSANIIDVLDQIDALTTAVDEMANNTPSTLSYNYLVGLGAQIDGLDGYNLVLNSNAVEAIGNHITEAFYDNLPAEGKALIQSTYNNRADRTTYADYEALFTQFATDLGYSA